MSPVFLCRFFIGMFFGRNPLADQERKKLLKQVEELRALFKDLDTDAWPPNLDSTELHVEFGPKDW